MKNNKKKWDKRFLRLSEEIASWSKDNSTKVGCVLVDGNKKIVGMGYNGFPQAVSDQNDWLSNRDIKYKIIIHAETNAIINAGHDAKGSTAYTNVPPCSNCTSSLIQAGVKRIVTMPAGSEIAIRFQESFRCAKMIMKSANIEYVEVKL